MKPFTKDQQDQQDQREQRGQQDQGEQGEQGEQRGRQEHQETGLTTDEEIDLVVGRGPSGAFAVAGVATAIVVALYVGFYFFVYLPRGAVQ